MGYILKCIDTEKKIWYVSDEEHGVGIRFTQNEFIETNKVFIENEKQFVRTYQYVDVVHIINELKKYLLKNHTAIVLK